MASTSRYGGGRGAGGPKEQRERLRHRSRPRHRRKMAASPPLPPGDWPAAIAALARPWCRRFSTAVPVHGTPAPLRCPVCRGCSWGGGRPGLRALAPVCAGRAAGPPLSRLYGAELAAFASSCRYWGTALRGDAQVFGGFMTWVRGSPSVTARCERRAGPVRPPVAALAWPCHALRACGGPELVPPCPTGRPRLARPPGLSRSAPRRLEPSCCSLACLHLIESGSHPKSVPALVTKLD